MQFPNVKLVMTISCRPFPGLTSEVGSRSTSVLVAWAASCHKWKAARGRSRRSFFWDIRKLYLYHTWRIIFAKIRYCIRKYFLLGGVIGWVDHWLTIRSNHFSESPQFQALLNSTRGSRRSHYIKKPSPRKPSAPMLKSICCRSQMHFPTRSIFHIPLDTIRPWHSL